MIEPFTEPEQQFVERLGLAAQGDGLPRIAGRIMGFLILKGGPVSFSELVDDLRVSRGSISTNTRLLDSLGVIDRVAMAGERQDYYQLAADPYGRLMEGSLKRMRKMQSIVDDAGATVSPAARERLACMSRFYQLAIDSTLALLERWRDEPR